MKKIFLFAAVVVLLSSCIMFGGKRVSGNGKIVSQARQVSSFNSIDAGGSMKIHIRQDASATVKIETDENLMEYIDVHTNGNTLVIKTKEGFNLDPTKDLIIYTSSPVYKGIDISGSCEVLSDGIISGTEALSVELSGSGKINMQVAVPKISTSVSGSGDVLLKGTSKEFEGSISGSGSIKAFDLETDNTKLDLSGASDAEVNAAQTLNVEVSGSGDVRYKGNASVSQSISGSGSVKKV